MDGGHMGRIIEAGGGGAGVTRAKSLCGRGGVPRVGLMGFGWWAEAHPTLALDWKSLA